MTTLGALYIYPVKSLGSIKLTETQIFEEGFQYDRLWMIVDELGQCITQREAPILNLIQIKLIDNGFYIYLNDQPKNGFILEHDELLKQKMNVTIWSSEFLTSISNSKGSEWLSDYLKQKVHLVKMDKNQRIKHTNFYPKPFSINFSDGYPIHIINQASVDDLSNRLGCQIEPLQFRPNIILNNLKAYTEDNINRIQIGNVHFDIIKRCERCIITTLIKNSIQFGKEPLKTLSGYRKSGNAIHFGIYAIAKDDLNPESQHISTNDRIELTISEM